MTTKSKMTSHEVKIRLESEMKQKNTLKNQINVSEFKAKALKLLDNTWRQGKEYILTKKGTPIARVIPFKKREQGSLKGSLKGLALIRGDIVHFDTSDDWEALKP